MQGRAQYACLYSPAKALIITLRCKVRAMTSSKRARHRRREQARRVIAKRLGLKRKPVRI